ncbi:MAG: PAS domain-containing protein [Salinimicrobium sediminis]|nr:PAS domain-containing protein [Salinimicrobium sediminis]MDX1752130.1 PAS domain-containing protein [Salinimicrobium sediminis]
MNEILSLPKGHPVSIYSEEKELIQRLAQELQETDPEAEYQKFYNIFNQLHQIERRFERKENQLFPFLEKRGWNGPSQGMWSFHDNLREQFRLLRKKIESRDFPAIVQDSQYLISGIFRLLLTEENVLFPNAMEILTEEDWKQVRKGEEEIGWMLPQEPAAFPEIKEEVYIHPAEDHTQRELSFSLENTSHYDEGYMTVDQVNLLLRTMPLDITYVDENDKVIFYNRGEERVFPRSAGIIGREVKFCHPPKSVGTVLKILEEFRKGTKNEAAFWINFKGRLIYIRYFAVRDKQKNYRGVIEMSQDITDIKNIEGEKRLLEWS